jgi:hypothetical protein
MKLSPEHEAYLKKLADPHYYGEQDENGVDLSLIRHNMQMTVEERLEQACRARRVALRLREIGQASRTK